MNFSMNTEKGLFVSQIKSPKRCFFFLFHLRRVQGSQHNREGVGTGALRSVLVVDSLQCFFSFSSVPQPTANEEGEHNDGSSVLSQDNKVIFLTSHCLLCVCFCSSLYFKLRNWAKTSLLQRIAHCAHPVTLGESLVY